MKKFINKYYYEFVVFIFCLLMFTLISVYIKYNYDNELDIIIRDAFYNFRGEKYGFWFFVFRFITEFGSYYFVTIIAIVVAICVKFDNRFWLLCIATIITYIANEVIKLFFMRERPIEELQWMSEYSSSFPSGHSMVATVFYGLITYYVYNSSYFKKRTKQILITGIAILVILIGISRMALGVHYFTDIIAGFCCGNMFLAIALYIYKAKFRKIRSVQIIE